MLNLNIYCKKVVPVIMGLIIATLVFIALNTYFLKTVSRVLVTGYFPANAVLKVHQLTASNKLILLDTITIVGKAPAVTQTVGTKILNKPIDHLNLQFSRTAPFTVGTLQEDLISIHSVQVTLPYTNDIFISQQALKDIFKSEQFFLSATDLFQYDDKQAINLTSKIRISLANHSLSFPLSLLFGLATFFILRNSQWSKIPAFSDINLGNNISSSTEFNTINGLRGFAALLVLFSHTAPGYEAVQMGLALLFVISGFLLTKPFVTNPDKIFSLANIEEYVTKRLKRILPMYFLFVFISYVLTFQFETAMRHFLFIQGSGHLWPMTQIFTFYMLLPFILLVTCWLHKRHSLLPAVLLIPAIYVWIFWVPRTPVYYNGSYSHPFSLYAFLIGVLGSYIHYDWIKNNVALRNVIEKNKTFLSIIAILITIVSIAWSAPVQPPASIHPWITQFYIKSILCVLIIILALNTANSWYQKILSNWLFRSVGVVGFSFYLLHSFGMQIITHIQSDIFNLAHAGSRSWSYTLASFIATYLMAIIAYSYVERPFFGYRRAEK